MKFRKLPVSVLIVACVFVLVGAIGFVYHLPDLRTHASEAVWIEATELLAFVAGMFILWGHNWARWLAVAWMAFHVVISFPVFREFLVHLLFLVVIAWILFRPGVGGYFAAASRRDS
ncbi:MAG TPA: hypothetical protein VMF66_13235 [Candidatus Acidoferrum sp.]|nr:hypothetical protein [Candidatus Acidoferrum sp.]